MATEILPVFEVISDETHSGMEIWQVWSIRPDGHNRVHAFPKFTLAQRVAEYDLDPEDVQGVLDVVLYEPYIPDLTMSPGAAKRAARPPTLFEAETPGAARKAHLDRIKEVKSRIQFEPHVRQDVEVGFALYKATKPAENPLQAILEDHRITTDEVERRRDLVHRTRAALQGKGSLRPAAQPIAQPFGVDKAPARRLKDMAKDKGNPEIAVAPQWVTLALAQE